MKLYTKMVLMIILSAISLTIEAEDLNKAMKVTSGGNVELENFKYILRNKSSIKMNTSYKIGNQVIHFSAYMPSYMTRIKSSQIDGLILLDAKDVKKGLYINNGYDKYGVKTPLSDWKNIISGFQYFCTSDSVAIAKTNCGNEQDYLAIVQQIVYTPPPAEKPAPIVIPQAPKEEYKFNCLGRVNFTGGEERFSEGGDIAIGKYSTHGEFYYHYRDKSWWERDVDGRYYPVICPERKKEIVDCGCPKTKEVEVVEKPSYYQHTESRQRFFAISFQPNYGYGGYQQPYYQPQQYYQPPQQYYQPPQTYQPPPFTGTPSNGGSTGDGYPSNGGSNGGYPSNGGNTGGYSSNGGASNGGGNPNGAGSNGGLGDTGQHQVIHRH